MATGVEAGGGQATAATHPTAVVHGSSAIRGLRHPRFAQQVSTNWSGYVASAGGYTHVSAVWRVPKVTVTGDDRYSSTWAGIGGDPTPDLIQAGTEQDSVGGQPVYQAWVEVLPAPELVQYTVNPGDLMSVDIAQNLPGLWTINLFDLTSAQTATVTVPYVSTYTTAEWIHEATTVSGGVATLATTTNAVFDLGYANGQAIASAGSVDSIVMQDGNGNTIATPSALTPDGDGFQVADGSTPPPVPGS